DVRPNAACLGSACPVAWISGQRCAGPFRWKAASVEYRAHPQSGIRIKRKAAGFPAAFRAACCKALFLLGFFGSVLGLLGNVGSSLGGVGGSVGGAVGGSALGRSGGVSGGVGSSSGRIGGDLGGVGSLGALGGSGVGSSLS